MQISKSFIINTKRLLLRLPSADDLPFVFSATKYKGFNDGMLWDPPLHMDELIPFHENLVKAWEKGERYTFSIVIKPENHFTGSNQ
jgi:[ribosomal protein S5]-alanine N-acetyltransferase